MKPISNLTIITLNQPNITDFAQARNQALNQVTTDWVLFLDSDETLSSELEQEIRQTLKSPTYSTYSIPRLDSFLGRQLHYGENGHHRFIRLARKNWGKWQRPVHEVWVGKGKVGQLHSPIIHHPHQNLNHFLQKINRYSTLEAEYRFSLKQRSSLFKLTFYPPLKFIYNYIILQGFRDGIPGTIMAVMMSFHSFLTWTKLYLLWHQK